MRRRLSRVFDTSAIVALFDAHPRLMLMVEHAHAGVLDVYLPAACVAEAGQLVGAGPSAWQVFQHTPGVEILHLSESMAVEISDWPGPLGVRHAAWEARHLRGLVVTAEPGLYRAMDVALQVFVPTWRAAG